MSQGTGKAWKWREGCAFWLQALGKTGLRGWGCRLGGRGSLSCGMAGALVASIGPWSPGQRAPPWGLVLSAAGVCVACMQWMVAGDWICWGGGWLLAGWRGCRDSVEWPRLMEAAATAFSFSRSSSFCITVVSAGLGSSILPSLMSRLMIQDYPVLCWLTV